MILAQNPHETVDIEVKVDRTVHPIGDGNEIHAYVDDAPGRQIVVHDHHREVERVAAVNGIAAVAATGHHVKKVQCHHHRFNRSNK